MTSWTVVTVTYNSARHLQRYWHGQAARDEFEWIVVDNGSTDGSVQIAESLADRVIQTKSNLGFGAANNIGLNAASGEFTAFVNPDVAICDSAWTTQLSRLIGDHGAIAAPQLANADGSLQPNARGLPFLRAKIRHRATPAASEHYARSGFSRPTYCAWLMGAALLGRRETFMQLGGWDERYFLYYEDHHIGLRAWEESIPLILDPNVVWHHDWQRETVSLNLRAWNAEFNSMRLFYREYPFLLWGSRKSRSLNRFLEDRGLEEMYRLLWTPADIGAGG